MCSLNRRQWLYFFLVLVIKRMLITTDILSRLSPWILQSPTGFGPLFSFGKWRAFSCIPLDRPTNSSSSTPHLQLKVFQNNLSPHYWRSQFYQVVHHKIQDLSSPQVPGTISSQPTMSVEHILRDFAATFNSRIKIPCVSFNNITGG